MKLIQLTHIAALSLLALSTTAMAETTTKQPVLIEMVYHHFPSTALKAEFQKNLSVVLKDLQCETGGGQKLKTFERPNNVTAHSLGVNGTVQCQIPTCKDPTKRSELLLTFYDDGTHNRKTMTQFELAQCGSHYRIVYRFAGKKQIGNWVTSKPDSESYRWKKEHGISDDSFYETETVVRHYEIK